MKAIKFYHTGSLLLLAVLTITTLFNSCSQSGKYPDEYGLALYTVRDAMSEDPVMTLSKVADMGYKYVEAANYNLSEGTLYGFSPEEFKKMCEDAGLKLVSSHISVEELLGENNTFDNEKASRMVDDHSRAGVKYIVCAHISNKYSKSTEGFRTIADACNKLGKMSKEKGLGMLYHNHSFEFDSLGDTDGFHILMENLDKNLVDFELDCYWATRAGKDPLTLITTYPGRFKALHLKDMAGDEEKSFAEVGYGTIDYKPIIQAGLKNGVKYFLVEQDKSKRKPMESAEMSAEYLNNINAEK